MSDPRVDSERPPVLSGQASPAAALSSEHLQRKAKRGLDVAVSALSLFLLLPVLVLVYLLVRCCDGPPAVFRQLRLGRGGRSFICLKFRTMVRDGGALLAERLGRDAAAREEWTRTHKLTDDPRVTPLGRFLRETSLDELPQLVNVLRGEMSLVGPRPILATEADRYGPAFATCFSVPPGITGLWQVSGRASLSFAERVELDLVYSTSWHLLRDLAILARTVPAVLARRGSC
jgi:exopolysaccharide production protein ExoY